jgi:hypothetical protein
MPFVPSALDDLLREIQNGLVIAERYSRKSTFFRYEPLLATGLLAVVAIIGGILLGGLRSTWMEALGSAPRAGEPSRGRAVR